MKFYIARDKDGTIWLFLDKPKLDISSGYIDGHCIIIGELPQNIFPEVTFENSPQEVELKLVNKL